LIEVESLVTGYGRIGVLNGVSLAVAPSECVGILGHNGTGKSTLLKAIAGLLPTWSGRIMLDGKPIERLAANLRARAGIGSVPQGRQIFPGLSVRENLHFAALAKGLDKSRAEAEVLADFPELGHLLDRPGSALSGGEQQLLALARALCGAPRLLLLDEPTEGIQPSIVQALIERIGMLRRKRGLTVLLVEQNLDFLRSLADRVLMIHRGRIGQELSHEAVHDPLLDHEFIGS
jgi:branched-chain amino acid transport system ATP-binding protein